VKIRLYKKMTKKMLHWYAEELTRLHPTMNPNGLANRYRLEDSLKVLQKQQSAREPQSEYWRLPVEVGVKDNVLFVQIPEQWERENVLYLDFDSEV